MCTHAESVNIILAVQVNTVSSKSATASQTGDTGERGGAAINVRKANTSYKTDENTEYFLLVVECSTQSQGRGIERKV